MTEEKVIDGIELKIEVLDSALKHGISRETILFVFENYFFDEAVDNDPAKTLMVGYNENANLVEMIAYEIEEDYLVVFHAMTCRKEYRIRAIK